MSTRHRPPAGRSLRHVGETRLNSPMSVDRAQVARTPVAIGPDGVPGPPGPEGPMGPPGPPGEDASAAPHHATHEPGGSDALTALDAGTLTTGTLADARLSANVALENVGNTFTQNQRVERVTPALKLVDTDQPADLRVFDLVNVAQQLWVHALNDAGGAGFASLKVTRLGDGIFARDVYEKARTTPIGHWQDVPFSAANFSGSGSMTWTVAAGHLLANRYTLIGKTLIWSVVLVGSSLAGTASNTAWLTPPLSLAAYYHPNAVAVATSNGTPITTRIQVVGGLVGMYRVPAANYATGSFDVEFTAMLELA